jgi:hypothetical protein
MEFHQHFGAAAFIVETLFEIAKKLNKLGVGVGVLLMDRAAVTGHAALLVLEMRDGVHFDEIDEIQDELNFAAVKVGGIGQALQLIDIINQCSVLRVDDRLTGFKSFGPREHSWFGISGSSTCSNG